MNVSMGFKQQLEVKHEYLMTARTHALTAVVQTLTSAEYYFKILYLTLISIMAVDHLLWDYIDYDPCREQNSMTSFCTKIVSGLTSTIFTIVNIQKAHFNNK